MTRTHLDVIILTDWALYREANVGLFRVVKNWVANKGGKIIMGGDFHEELSSDDFQRDIEKWKLPWKLDEVPLTYHFNRENVFRMEAHNLDDEYRLQGNRAIIGVGRGSCPYSQPPPQDETTITQGATTPIDFTNTKY